MVAEVLRDPQDVTVYENKLAVFFCEIRGDTSTWRVNSTYLSELPHMLRSMINITKNRTDDNRKSTELSINATLNYNGTTIQCLAILGVGSFDESEIAELKVQGTLKVETLFICEQAQQAKLHSCFISL